MVKSVKVLASVSDARRALWLAVSGLALSIATIPVTVRAETRCNEAYLPQPEGCARSNAGLVVGMPVGSNAEAPRDLPGTGFADSGFSISLDTAPVAGAKAPANPDRATDMDAAGAGVDIRFDGLDPRRMLNVSTNDLRATFRSGEQVGFRASSNYPAWIAKAEIRLYDLEARGRPVVTTLPVAANGTVDWTMPATGSARLGYALRVYDAKGRYDETIVLPLSRSDGSFATHDTTGTVIAAGEAEDRTRIRNIPVQGARITVSGDSLGQTVRVMGEPVPVDGSGRFVVSRIVPVGTQNVTVERGSDRIARQIAVPAREWFYVGIGDLTFGHRFKDELASADPAYRSTYVDGRLAGYAKGRTSGGYTITTSIDTGEGPVKDAFRRLGDKDPRRVIERLNPQDLYLTYGDDSTVYDDAPTSGRFYLRVERDASSLTWGDFRTDVRGTEFLRQSRGLYGAELKYVSTTTTNGGAPRANVLLYGAQPDTLPQRDILRGTGGSVYFLSHQDITGSSETLTVETVDPVTGRIVDRKTLAAGADYDIDYLQGIVTLSHPLSSSATNGALVSSGTSGSYDVNLVVQYEYTPTTGSLKGASLGGRVEVMAGEHLRLGVTAMRESTGTADQHLAGVDLRYELGATSFIEAEIAQTKGPGFSKSLSTDGGLTINSSGVTNDPRALGYRIDSHFDLAELGLATKGTVGFYGERKQAGFSTLTEDITEDQTLVGLTGDVALTAKLSFGGDLERFHKHGGDKKDRGEVRLSYALSERLTLQGALASLDQTTAADPKETGRRTDAALRLTYQKSDDLTIYGFGQTTLAWSGGIGRNDRLGVGFDARLTEKLTASGEISGGARGRGAAARLSYAATADNEVYAGYKLDPTRTGAGTTLVGSDGGTLVLGAKYRLSEQVSTFTEQTVDLFGNRHSLARTYGVTYTPTTRWTISGSAETGEVRDPTSGNFNRTALSLGASYANDDKTTARLRAEYRTEDGVGIPQDRKTWALSGGYEYKVNDNWRFLANLDSLISRSDATSFRDGEYIDANLGFAYRPALDDRMNLLLKYRYLRDLPGADQVASDGTKNGPLQVSHVFSVDGDYNLTPKWTLGGKYGFRTSKIAPRGTNSFTDSTAHLAILRADWHVVHEWDLMGEGRVLYTSDTGDTDLGAVVALYRHLGDHAKVGIGYELGHVSDDVASLGYRTTGVFLNIVGKF